MMACFEFDKSITKETELNKTGHLSFAFPEETIKANIGKKINE